MAGRSILKIELILLLLSKFASFNHCREVVPSSFVNVVLLIWGVFLSFVFISLSIFVLVVGAGYFSRILS